MRLIEVVMLMGAHCVSPVEHSQLMTQATKVQCAVVVEKDTDRGTLRVTPETAAKDPRVAQAMAHLEGVAQTAPRIVPTAAPPASATLQVPEAPAAANAPAQPPTPPPEEKAVAVEDVASAPPPPSAPPATAKPEAAPPAAATKVAAATAPPRKKQQQAEAQSKQANGQCKGAAVAKWYKAADGHRKYRCVRPVPAGDIPPAQLY